MEQRFSLSIAAIEVSNLSIILCRATGLSTQQETLNTRKASSTPKYPADLKLVMRQAICREGIDASIFRQ